MTSKTIIVNGEIIRVPGPSTNVATITGAGRTTGTNPATEDSTIGVQIDMKDLKDGRRVNALCRLGMGYEGGIYWFEPSVHNIRYVEHVNTNNEEGINSYTGWGYAGFHAETGTYWHFKKEGEVNRGEHCMQILKLIYPEWTLKTHRLFGEDLRTAVKAFMTVRRRDRCPVARLPVDIVYEVLKWFAL